LFYIKRKSKYRIEAFIEVTITSEIKDENDEGDMRNEHLKKGVPKKSITFEKLSKQLK
jgi:hypothetical protein